MALASEFKMLRKIRQLDTMISQEQMAMRRTASLLSSIAPSSFYRTSRSDSDSHPECEFLAAVRVGNGAIISSFLIDSSFNVNIADSSGRCPLETAVDDHPDLVQLLLPRANLAQLRSALFSAIRKDSVPLVTELLKSSLLNDPANLSLLSHVSLFSATHLECFSIPKHSCSLHPSSKQQSRSIERFDSPMVSAAIRGCLDIVRAMLVKGFTVPRPHSYLCSCSECVSAKLEDFIHFSRMRMLVYSAFCSDVFLLLTTSDPIVASFELSQELQNLAYTEQERSAEFETLAESASKIAVNLLEQCRDSTETVTVLSRGASPIIRQNERMSLDAFEVVRLAIKYRQKLFIAHHLTQRFLDMKWTQGMEKLSKIPLNNKLFAMLALILLAIFSPIRAFIYILHKHKPFVKVFRPIEYVFRAPYMKFADHVASHISFLVLISLSSSASTPSAFGLISLACHRPLKADPKLLSVSISNNAFFAFWVIGFMALKIRESLVMSRNVGRRRWRFGRDLWSNISWVVMAFYILSGISHAVLALIVAVDPLYQKTFCHLVNHEDDDRGSEFSTNETLNIYRSEETLACEVITHMNDPTHEWLSPLHWDPRQLANAFLAVSVLMSYFLLISYLPIIDGIGPLVVTFQRMIADLVAAFVACALLTLAFLVAIETIYSKYSCMDAAFSSPAAVTTALVATLFGIESSYSTPDIRIPKTKEHEDFYKNLFQHAGFSQSLGYVLFSGYLICVALVLITLLKLLTLETFSRIFATQRDIEWKFVRTELRLKFYGDFNALAPPFNLIEYLHDGICSLIRKCWPQIAVADAAHSLNTIQVALHSASLQSFDSHNIWWSSDAGRWQHWQSWIATGSAGKDYLQTCQQLVDRHLHRNEKMTATVEKKNEMLGKIERKLLIYRRELRRLTALIAAELAKSTAAINAECDRVEKSECSSRATTPISED